MDTLTKLVDEALADGKLSDSELRGITIEIMADGVVSRDEFAQFCRLLNGISGHPENSVALPTVAKLIAAAHLLEDADSPGVLTAEEKAEIVGLIGADGKIDAVEQVMLDFVVNMSAHKGELSREIFDAGKTLGDAIKLVLADGVISDAEAKTLFFRIMQDGEVDDAELAAVIALHQQAGDTNALWQAMFPVLLLRAVVVDTDTETFDVSADEAEMLKVLADNGLDAIERESLDAILALAATDHGGLGDWYKQAA